MNRIAFVQSCWHRDIVDVSRLSFTKAIRSAGYQRKDIDFFEVPGAFEIPLHVKLLAGSGDYAAVVAAGLVIDGGIYRHDFVAASVIDALMRIGLETEVPVISVVLTPHQFHAHEDHVKFFRKHFVVKGVEAAHACSAAIRGMQSLRASFQSRPERGLGRHGHEAARDSPPVRAMRAVRRAGP